MVVYFLAYKWFMEYVFFLEENPDAALGAIESSFGPFSILGEISLLSPLPTTVFLAISVGITLLSWFIISKNYVKIITGSKSSAKKKYKREKLASGSLLTALVKKEMGIFLSSSTYILNASAGIIFNVMIIFAAFPLKDALLSEDLGVLAILGGTEFIYLAVTAILSGMAFMNSISASAVSMEGKHWWITKSAPIPTRAMIYAKLAPHLLIALPISLVSSVVIAAVLNPPILWWLPIVFIPAVANAVSAMLGLVLNIAFPKFDFTNEAQVVKQSLPSFITVMLGFVLTFGSSAAAFFLSSKLSATVSAIVIAVFYLAAFLVLYLILTGPSERRLEKL
jgi:ABC-2 type transport system permease protein